MGFLRRHLVSYPLSIITIMVVVYLSFFTPPSTPLDGVTNIDKLVHAGMYFFLTSLLWLEFFRSHPGAIPWKHAVVGAFILPLVFSGAIELLQEYATTHRSGEWWDFASNTFGVVMGAVVALLVLRPMLRPRDKE